MLKKVKFSSISFRLGLLFSGIFFVLLLLLGFILYAVFTNVFVDYIKHDLLARGNNHASILEENFNNETIAHVIEMEKGVKANVLITDRSNRILGSSKAPDQAMKQKFVQWDNMDQKGRIIESNWQKEKYLASVSPIGDNAGYVYMYYPSSILRDIVFVVNVLFAAASVGIVLMAFGVIGIFSQRLTRPLLAMKEATSKMALGKYKQRIPIQGNDEIAQLGNSIQVLGEQLQFFENSRNEFLAAVSHELRTPLTYLKGYSDVLNKGLIKDADQKAEYLRIINKEAQRISLLVNDLFDMSQLQVGKFHLNKERANLNLLIEKVISNLRPVAVKKDLLLSGYFQSDLPEIEVDTQRMEQVIYNLLENAIKYTQKGTVTVRTFSKHGLVMVEITDTGEGIPSEEIPKIWERFYRVDQSRARKTGGTGLGLYVVKQIIESHGGEITVKSKKNEGTTFTIYLK